MSEKIAGAKGTELDDEFHDMEKVPYYWNCYFGCQCSVNVALNTIKQPSGIIAMDPPD